MDRRRFLSSLAAAAVGMTLDPERLLWVPGQKKIFIPSPRVSEGLSVLFRKYGKSGLARYIDDVAFYAGDQWPEDVLRERQVSYGSA